MPQFDPIQTNFTSGELSPRLAGRVDLAKYFNGVSIMQNFTIHPHGGASVRSGTRHVAAVKTASSKVRLIEFEFSTTQAYIIEFGDLYIRFYRNEGQIVSGSPLAAVEVATPYVVEDLFDIKFAQSADTLYIAHPNYAPRKLTRSSHTSWTLSTISFTANPFSSHKTITGITQANPAVVTSTAHGFADGDIVYISEVAGMTEVNKRSFTVANKAANTFELSGEDSSAYTAYSSGGNAIGRDCPAAVALYEERSVWAGSGNDPQNIWFSVSGDFEDMTTGTADDDAMVFTIATDQVNAIRWVSPGDTLMIGTVGGEFEGHGTTPDQPVTPTSIQINRQTTFGSANIQPIRVGAQLLFVQRAGRKIRNLVFNFDSNGFVAPDLAVLSEHITRGGITDVAYQQEPDSVIKAVRSDGQLLGMTYDQVQDIIGWERDKMGGTDAVVESVASIPSPNGDHNQVWISIARTINGGTVRYVEFFEQEFTEDDAQEDAFFVDSGLTYDGTPVSSVSGLDHLEGETVTILADGATHPTKVVVSGAITLDRSAQVVHVGEGYAPVLESMRLEMQTGIVAQGKKARIHRANIRFHNTLGGKIGPDAANMDTIVYRTGSDPMDAPPPLFTGDKELPFEGEYSTNAKIRIEQDAPLPMTVLSWLPEGHVYG